MKNYQLYRSEYFALKGATQRCHCETHFNYPLYGGRGLEVAPEWRGRGAFDRFLEHIGPKPSPELTLDRIDNDKGYQPGNVRWVTIQEQARNRRSNAAAIARRLKPRNDAIKQAKADGLTVAEIAAKFGLSATHTYRLIKRP